MIKHYCDACGKDVTVDTAIIKAKELTIEDDDGLKLSIAFEIDTMKNQREIAEPAVCARCVARRLTEWAVSLEGRA